MNPTRILQEVLLVPTVLSTSGHTVYNTYGDCVQYVHIPFFWPYILCSSYWRSASVFQFISRFRVGFRSVSRNQNSVKGCFYYPTNTTI